jgi:hypothetical protein
MVLLILPDYTWKITKHISWTFILHVSVYYLNSVSECFNIFAPYCVVKQSTCHLHANATYRNSFSHFLRAVLCLSKSGINKQGVLQEDNLRKKSIKFERHLWSQFIGCQISWIHYRNKKNENKFPYIISEGKTIATGKPRSFICSFKWFMNEPLSSQGNDFVISKWEHFLPERENMVV